MTTAEWQAYGDASASHQAVVIDGTLYQEWPSSPTTVTIDGVTYTALAHVRAMPHQGMVDDINYCADLDQGKD